jgi:hypothetical protein
VLIKVLLLVGIAAIAVLTLRIAPGARHLALRRIGVLLFALVAVGSVLAPDAWNAVAAFVGVGRGTDLLLYGLIILFLGSMATTYRRFRGMESTYTVLARRIALDEAFGTGPALAGGPGTSPAGTADDARPSAEPGRSAGSAAAEE